MCESSAYQERQEDHSLRSQRRLPQLHRGDALTGIVSSAVAQFNSLTGQHLIMDTMSLGGFKLKRMELSSFFYYVSDPETLDHFPEIYGGGKPRHF